MRNPTELNCNRKRKIVEAMSYALWWFMHYEVMHYDLFNCTYILEWQWLKWEIKPSHVNQACANRAQIGRLPNRTKTSGLDWDADARDRPDRRHDEREQTFIRDVETLKMGDERVVYRHRVFPSQPSKRWFMDKERHSVLTVHVSSRKENEPR